MTTICPAYEGSVRTSWYPVMLVLKTASPETRPGAPKEEPSKTEPSHRTRNALSVNEPRRTPWCPGRTSQPPCPSLLHLHRACYALWTQTDREIRSRTRSGRSAPRQQERLRVESPALLGPEVPAKCGPAPK